MYGKMTLRKEAIGVKGTMLLSPYIPASSHTIKTGLIIITMQVYVCIPYNTKKKLYLLELKI
jgi:hypothetical protein